MEPGGLALVFVVGAVVSLGTSWLLVSRIERLGERFGLSEALLNVAVGLLLPAAVLRLGGRSDHGALLAAWYLGLTVLALGLAHHDRGLHRAAGLLIVGAYLALVGSLVVATHTARFDPGVEIAPAAGVALAGAAQQLRAHEH